MGLLLKTFQYKNIIMSKEVPCGSLQIKDDILNSTKSKAFGHNLNRRGERKTPETKWDFRLLRGQLSMQNI